MALNVRAIGLEARLADVAELLGRPHVSAAECRRVTGALRTPPGAALGTLEGCIPLTALRENQRAIVRLRAHLRACDPDVIVGMERGGAFLADALAHGDRDLAARVRRVPVHRAPPGSREKFAPEMLDEFERLVEDGARALAVVDYYIGGTTAPSLLRQVLRPLAARHRRLRVDVQWIRETFGMERTTTAAGTTVAPRLPRTAPAGRTTGMEITTTVEHVRLVLGDDLEIALAPASAEPIRTFDESGRVVEVLRPRAGDTSRDLLIELLNAAPG